MKSFLDKYKFFVILIVLKGILAFFFSSGYKDTYFVPFITHFVTHFENPWQYFYTHPSGAEFPYHPFMLYILALFSYLPINLGDTISFGISNLLFKIPLFIADISIAAILIKYFKNRQTEVLLFYFCSPIILFSTYMHSQLDLIPTALLMGSLYALFKRKLPLSAVLTGLAIGSKFHIITVLPLIAVYIYQSRNKRSLLRYFTWAGATYAALTLPYLFSPGFLELVLNNPKQNLVFNLGFTIENNIIYITLAIVLFIYGRFFWYKKINQDLLFSFIGILFSTFILLVLPRPAWYVWIVPFLSFFMIRYHRETHSGDSRKLTLLYGGLNVIYIIYFVFFNVTEVPDLTFFQTPLNLKISSSPKLVNSAYTLLEVSLLSIIVCLYIFGVKSNEVYKRVQSIIIGIGGDSGSGKSVVLGMIKALHPEKMLELESDGVHKWERKDKNWETYTHSDPKANNLHSLASQLLQLKTGESVQMRFYDHSTGTFTAPKTIKSNDFILLSGLHPFYLPHMRKIVDIKLFMDTDESLRRLWKVKRDVDERGHSKDAILKSIKKRESDSIKHIQSQKEFADIIVHYYPKSPISLDNDDVLNNPPELNLKITVNTEVDLDPLISLCAEKGLLNEWDYSENLTTLFLDLSGPLDDESLRKCAENNIINLNEIWSSDSNFESGFQGIIQLVILFYVSEKLKSKVS